MEELAEKITGFHQKGGTVVIHVNHKGEPWGLFLDARKTAYEHEHQALKRIRDLMQKKQLKPRFLEFGPPKPSNKDRPISAKNQMTHPTIRSNLQLALHGNDTFNQLCRLLIEKGVQVKKVEPRTGMGGFVVEI